MTRTVNPEILQILRRCEVFLGLHEADLEKAAALPSVRLETYEKGATIASEGEPARNLYVLVEGKVDLRMRIHRDLCSLPEEITVDTVTRGSIFHWSSLVRPYMLGRTSVCAEKSKVLAISGKELIDLMNRDEHIGYEIMQSIAAVISSRLRIPNDYFWADCLRRKQSAP